MGRGCQSNGRHMGRTGRRAGGQASERTGSALAGCRLVSWLEQAALAQLAGTPGSDFHPNQRYRGPRLCWPQCSTLAQSNHQSADLSAGCVRYWGASVDQIASGAVHLGVH